MLRVLWAIFAVIAYVLFAFSDAATNLSAVKMFATDDLSLYAWVAIAIAFAVAGGPLTFAAEKRKWLYIPAIMVVAGSGVLTSMSTNTDFAARSARAKAGQDLRQGLVDERKILKESLNPTDGSVPCADSAWCNSGKKEARVREINALLSSSKVEVDPLATPGGKKMATALSAIRGLFVPVILMGLGAVSGIILIRNNSGNIRGSFRNVFRKPNSQSFVENQRSNRKVSGNFSEPIPEELLRNLVLKWLGKHPRTRINLSDLRNKVGVQDVDKENFNKLIEQLCDEHYLVRYKNGQIGKIADKPKARLRVLKGGNDNGD